MTPKEPSGDTCNNMNPRPNVQASVKMKDVCAAMKGLSGKCFQIKFLMFSKPFHLGRLSSKKIMFLLMAVLITWRVIL